MTLDMSPAEFGRLLDSLACLPYGLEAVDQRAHALQSAGLARAGGWDDDMILACALHDVGRAPAVAATFEGLPHELAGARVVGALIGARAGALVGGHVTAKRYLAADLDYALSPASVASLAVQGGPMSAAQRAAFEADRLCEEMLALRRYDDAAKVPGASAPSVAEIVALYSRLRSDRC
ncbi:MAG: HD family phosphohydrolase [Vulcanimicrobiaceae bacterium]